MSEAFNSLLRENTIIYNSEDLDAHYNITS